MNNLLIMSLFSSLALLSFVSAKDSCVDELNQPKPCYPEFENIAYERQVTVTNTCGIDLT
jgi:hypothetical protein